MTLADFLYYALIILILFAGFALIMLAGGYMVFRHVDHKLRRCPNCKRGAAGTIVETETEFLGAKIDHSGKKPVRIRREKVTDHYKCDYCDHTWVRTFERKERIPLQYTSHR